MINYADETFYTGSYLSGREAVIDTASFDYYVRKATLEIKQYTFFNISDSSIPDEVKMCCCEVAEAFYKNEQQSNNSNITSEKVGSYSVTYADKEKTKELFKNECYEIISRWLLLTGFMYQGGGYVY
jgi:hypothetical protein